MSIVKSPSEIEIMAEGGKILAKVMREVIAKAKAGVSLKYLDEYAQKLIEEAGAKPAFLGYRPEGAREAYPASICASVNEVVVHGIPSGYVIREGDLVKLDFGVRHKGFCTDAAFTVVVGEASEKARELVEATRTALFLAIQKMVPGNTLGDIGAAVEQFVEGKGFRIIRDLTGHGIGRRLHEEPSVYNYGKPGQGLKLTPGMVFALEPITALSTNRVRQQEDDSFITADGSVSAHFEHTVAVTEEGPRILTVL
jgi:methionyl aminopeptidase